MVAAAAAGCCSLLLLDAMMPVSTEFAVRSRVPDSTATTIRCACARGLAYPASSTDLVVDSGSTWTPRELMGKRAETRKREATQGSRGSRELENVAG